MKHNLKITIILLSMFLITQFIGLYVVNFYSPVKIIDGEIQNKTSAELPYGMQPPEIEQEKDFYYFFPSLIFAFVIAISLFFLITKFQLNTIIKIWFFVVVAIALGITLKSFFPQNIKYISLLVLLITIPLAYIKTFKKEFLVHNLTELFIYPGIAAVFVPILNLATLIFLLILISVYDMWAVWKSGFMQKIAKYQINKLNMFSGFFLPHADKKTKQKIKLFKQKFKEKKISEKKFKNKKFKVNIAILGGGDIIFPIISAGVVLKTFGFTTINFLNTSIVFPLASLITLLGATAGLSYLFFFAEKKKFYPAMPYITAGIFLGIILAWILV